MKRKNNGGFSVHNAVNPNIVIVVVYAVLKQILCAFDYSHEELLIRAAGNAAMIIAVIVVTKSKRLNGRALAYAAPLSTILIEIATCALVGGDQTVYIFLIGCSLVSLMYLDTKAYLITMITTVSVVSTLVFILGIPILTFRTMENYKASVLDNVYNISAMILIDVLVFFISRYSVDAFKKFATTSRTFDALMETTPNHLLIINEKACVEYISRSLASLLGLSNRVYAHHRPLLDLCRWDELKLLFQEVMETGTDVERSFELKIDGTPRWFMLRSSLTGNSSVARIFEISEVTPIVEAKNEAESATRAKSSFLANMSHEIRTPLNAISGLIELMMLRPLDSEQLSHAVAIKGASMSLLNIVNDILDFSKIDAQKMEIIIRYFDFASLINDTVNIINIKAGSAGIVFTVFVSKDIPPQINGDELRLKQVLLNLLNNAVKFTREGCVHLNVSSETTSNGALKLFFSIQDTGIGIKEEDAAKLFGEFAQLDTKKNRGLEGTGLGLAISRRLVELMGGSISVDSEYGKGSVFSFYVICHGKHTGKLAVLPEPLSYRVLCYEPNPYHTDVFRHMLESLDVPYEISVSPGDLAKRLESGGFTHIFYHKSAESLVSKKANGAVLTLLKEVHDHVTGACNMVNRPILITTLVQILKNGATLASDGGLKDEIKLGAFNTKGVRALLVDDNPVNLMVAEGMLRQYGIDIVTASGGQEGIDKALSGEFDIIFMDHMMPDVDGIDAVAAIRAHGGRHAELPVIALSANAISGVEELFARAGMNGFLSKPIVIKKLHNILLQFLPEEKIVREE